MTARPILTRMQTSELQAAQALLRDDNADGAIGRIRPLLAGGLVHADAYALFAAACHAKGLLSEARTSWNAAINLDPGNARFWAALADLLEASGDLTPALTARQRVAALNPDDAVAATMLGEFLLLHGDAEAAEPALQRAVTLDPDGLRSRHALAVALRLLDRFDDADAVLARLLPAHAAPPATLALHGHILGDLGRFDAAIDRYRAAIAADPGNIDAQETLARLLPQIGQVDGALDGYRAALASNPSDAALWASALGSAQALGRSDDLLILSRQAIRHFPDRRDFAVLHADALGATGAIDTALDLLEPLATGPAADPLAAIQAAHWRLASGDPGAAERHAQRAVDLAPDSQAAWAYLGTCWRLRGDPREAWLNDYDRITTTMMLEPPSGYGDTASFLVDLRAVLDAMHLTMEHPADQSLRHGTQTRGHLFLRRNPLIEALGIGLHRQIEGWLQSLPSDPSHPFMRRNSGRIAFKNSWSVRLRDQGFHISHIHQDGWLSSAFYVALPPELADAAEAGGLPRGALTFGVPDASLGLDLAPQRVVRPEVGMLVLFPSYVWHATVPFASAQPRTSVAFDAVPARTLPS